MAKAALFIPKTSLYCEALDYYKAMKSEINIFDMPEEKKQRMLTYLEAMFGVIEELSKTE